MRELEGVVLRENLVRLDGLPLVLRVPSLPETAGTGARVRLVVRGVDLLERTVDLAYRETLAGDASATVAAADTDEKA